RASAGSPPQSPRRAAAARSFWSNGRRSAAVTPRGRTRPSPLPGRGGSARPGSTMMRSGSRPTSPRAASRRTRRRGSGAWRANPPGSSSGPPAREHGGGSLVAALTRVVSRHHRIRLRAGIEATELLRENGAVTGVGVKPDRRGAPTIAGRVLLAGGGFVAEDELIARHCPAVSGLPAGGAPLATGDGLRFAVAARARTRGLGGCEVTALYALPAHLEVPTVLL